MARKRQAPTSPTARPPNPTTSAKPKPKLDTPPLPKGTRLLGHGLAIALAGLFAYGGQAHLTGAITPKLHEEIIRNAKVAERIWGWTGLEADQIRAYFGLIALLTMSLISRSATRKSGLILALAFTAFALYNSWMEGADLLGQMIIFQMEISALVLLST